MKRRLAAMLIAAVSSLTAAASAFDYALSARMLAPGVHVLIGQREDFSTENGGNIVNTAFIVAPAGIIVIDSGPSRRYGEQLRQLIARTSSLPLAITFNTHHHPDHFLGNQAFADQRIAALPATSAGIAREGNALAENLFRLTGNWMKGTEPVVPDPHLTPGPQRIAGRLLRLIALHGHSEADLAIYDESSGTLFTGDLVFNGRAPTTPHADMAHWLNALDTLEAITREPGFKTLVPGHGDPTTDATPIAQTRQWLRWLQATMRQAAEAGLDMNEVLALPLPPELARLPVAASEYRRSVGHLFPQAERQALEGRQ